MSNRFPLKAPIAPCKGWLAHNTQACNCYAEDREAEANRPRGLKALLMKIRGKK